MAKVDLTKDQELAIMETRLQQGWLMIEGHYDTFMSLINTPLCPKKKTFIAYYEIMCLCIVGMQVCHNKQKRIAIEKEMENRTPK